MKIIFSNGFRLPITISIDPTNHFFFFFFFWDIAIFSNIEYFSNIAWILITAQFSRYLAQILPVQKLKTQDPDPKPKTQNPKPKLGFGTVFENLCLSLNLITVSEFGFWVLTYPNWSSGCTAKTRGHLALSSYQSIILALGFFRVLGWLWERKGQIWR